MITTVDNVEITPAIIQVLKKWYENPEMEGSEPERFVRWLGGIQDCLCRVLIENIKIDDAMVKECLSQVIYIKDDFKQLIPIEERKQS